MNINLKWKTTSVILLCAVIAGLVFIGVKSRERDQGGIEPSLSGLPSETDKPDSEVEQPQDLYDFTASHMVQYAAKETSAQDDVQTVSLMLESAFLMMKNQMPSFSGNQELVAILQGKNPSSMKFLSGSFPHVGQDGQLLDRWRKPLFFHQINGSSIDVRSAGPDGIMWNGDDVHTGRQLETSETFSK